MTPANGRPLAWYVVRGGRVVAGFNSKQEARAAAAGGQVWARGNLARLGLDWRSAGGPGHAARRTPGRPPSARRPPSLRSDDERTVEAVWVRPEVAAAIERAWIDLARSGPRLTARQFARRAKELTESICWEPVQTWRSHRTFYACLSAFEAADTSDERRRTEVLRGLCDQATVGQCRARLGDTLRNQQEVAERMRGMRPHGNKARLEAATADAVACLQESFAAHMRAAGPKYRRWVAAVGRRILEDPK